MQETSKAKGGLQAPTHFTRFMKKLTVLRPCVRTDYELPLKSKTNILRANYLTASTTRVADPVVTNIHSFCLLFCRVGLEYRTGHSNFPSERSTHHVWREQYYFFLTRLSSVRLRQGFAWRLCGPAASWRRLSGWRRPPPASCWPEPTPGPARLPRRPAF